MEITKIETQRYNPDRVNIYINGNFAFGLADELRYKYNLSKGQEVTDEFINNILNSEEQNKIINYTLKYLSYRERSEKEVYDKLKSKSYDEDKIQYAIEYCLNHNYINDERFAKLFIKDKINLNKLGSQRIKYELIAKGISPSIIDKVLIPDYNQEFDIAVELALKKLPRYRNDDYNTKYRKLGGYLQRRGYSFDIVKNVLNQVLN